MSNVQLGYTQVIDPISFKSIPSGRIYIGEYGTLPNPANAGTWKQAYFVNSDGTRTAASQPIATNAAGYAVDGSGNIKTIQVDGQYSILVQNSFGSTKFSNEKPTNSISVLDVDLGDGRSQADKNTEIVSGADFGAIGDGVADDYFALQSAVDSGDLVHLIDGNYRITQPIVCGANFGGLFGNGAYRSVISKEFNGDAIKCDTNGGLIESIGIVGNGATYSGGGIRPRGYNVSIRNCRIVDTADSPILVEGAVGSNALAATYLNVSSCFLLPTDTANTYAVRAVSSDDPNRPTVRTFDNISGGGNLVDFSGMNYAVMRDSLGAKIKFDANCSKVILSNNRLTNAGSSIVVYGKDHVIQGNIFGFGAGFGLSIDPTATGIYYDPVNNIVVDSVGFNSIASGVSLGAANTHNLHTNLLPYTFGWYGSVTNPTLGNSTTYAYYVQQGRVCNATFGLVRGSTAVVGSGIYTFQLPFKAHVTSTGIARIKSSSGVFYAATFIIQGGSDKGTMYIDGLSSEFSSSSIAFSTGSTIDCSVTYFIAPN